MSSIHLINQWIRIQQQLPEKRRNLQQLVWIVLGSAALKVSEPTSEQRIGVHVVGAERHG